MNRPGKSSLDNNNLKDKIEDIKEWVSDHAKIVMPAVLLACVLITVVIAVSANKKTAEEVEAQTAEMEVLQETAVTTQAEEGTPQLELEENAYPAVNTLMNNYYTALANGDIEAVLSMNAFVDDTEKIRIQEMSKYIDSYPELNVYTKLGPVENSYLVYVYSKVKFTEYDKLVPGMQAFYVCTDENGNTYINEGEDNSVVTNYIRDISLQDDVVELNNRIAVEYNELLESDDELTAFLADLSGRIDVSVGEALAKAEAEAAAPADGEQAESTETSADGEQAEGTDAEEQADGEGDAAAEETNTVKTVRAKEVVNVRSSDSETADKVGKAQTGDEFTLLEEKGNGWSKITFEGKDAYIKSEYLEVVAEEPAETDTQSEENNDTEENNDAEETNDADEVAADPEGKTVTVLESVNVRKSASESGEKLGLVYEGEKLELVMKQADGWTKVKYKGKTAYVKSDYVK